MTLNIDFQLPNNFPRTFFDSSPFPTQLKPKKYDSNALI